MTDKALLCNLVYSTAATPAFVPQTSHLFPPQSLYPSLPVMLSAYLHTWFILSLPHHIHFLIASPITFTVLLLSKHLK